MEMNDVPTTHVQIQILTATIDDWTLHVEINN